MGFPVFTMAWRSSKTTVTPVVKEGLDPDKLPPILKKHYGEKPNDQKWSDVEELDPKVSVYAVEALRIFARKAIAARRDAVNSKDKPSVREKQVAAIAVKRELDALVSEGGPSLEKAHRQFLGYERMHRRFTRLRDELTQINRRIDEVRKGRAGEVKAELAAHAEAANADSTKKVEAPFDERAELARRQKAAVHEPVNLSTITAEEMRYLFGESEVTAALAEIRKEPESGDFNAMLAAGDVDRLGREQESRMKQVARLWNDPMVRYLQQIHMVKNFVAGIERGEEVLEMPYTVRKWNELVEIEADNPYSTIGAVCVGEPGTGKSTLIRYRLAHTGRTFQYMDLSREVTRYQYLGSKEVNTRSPLYDLKEIIETVQKADEETIAELIQRGAKKHGDYFTMMVEEAAEDSGNPQRAKLERVLKTKLADVLADEVYKAGKKNGWRYGFLMSCLKRSTETGIAVCPIFDEFNKAENMDPIFGLMTCQGATDEEAGPMPTTSGEEVKGNPRGWYYFADNDEWMRIPKDWKMYFTGNIGTRHQVFPVPPALMNRLQGKIIQFDYPPIAEEMLVTHALLCDPDLEFRAPYGVAEGLRILIAEVFPKMRAKKGKDRFEPVSLRTVHNIADILYDRENEVSKCDSIADLDRAIIRVMLGDYKLKESRELPSAIAEMMINVGLLLSPEVEGDVVEWLCKNPKDATEVEQARENIKKAREEHGKPNGALEKLRDNSRFSVQSAWRGPPGMLSDDTQAAVI